MIAQRASCGHADEFEQAVRRHLHDDRDRIGRVARVRPSQRSLGIWGLPPPGDRTSVALDMPVGGATAGLAEQGRVLAHLRVDLERAAVGTVSPVREAIAAKIRVRRPAPVVRAS